MRQLDARPLVSVIIPVFNRAERLAHAVESVQAQSLTDWELIIVDDGSREPLDTIVSQFDDPRIVLLRHDVNRGVSAARNTGLDAARGKLAAFLDSDDEWLPEKLLVQSSLIARQPAPEKAFCATRTLVIKDRSHHVVLPRTAPERGRNIAEFLYAEDGGFAQASSYCLPLEMARRVRFCESLRQYEDHLFLIEAIAAGAQYVLAPQALNVWHDDERPDRLGANGSLASGRHFLSVAAPFMSPRAIAAFEARCLGPQLWRENMARALAKFYAAYRAGGLSKAQAARLLARCFLPGQWLRRAQHSLHLARTRRGAAK